MSKELHFGYLKLISLPGKSSHFRKYLQIRASWEQYTQRSIQEAGGWELVILGGPTSQVNFNFLLRSSGSEQISSDTAWWVDVCCFWVKLQGAGTSQDASSLLPLGFPLQLSNTPVRTRSAR